MGMEALKGDYMDRANRALAAGCEMVITSFSTLKHGMAGTVFDEENYATFTKGYAVPPMTVRAEKVMRGLVLPPAPDAGEVAEANARLRRMWDDGAGRMGYKLDL